MATGPWNTTTSQPTGHVDWFDIFDYASVELAKNLKKNPPVSQPTKASKGPSKSTTIPIQSIIFLPWGVDDQFTFPLTDTNINHLIDCQLAVKTTSNKKLIELDLSMGVKPFFQWVLGHLPKLTSYLIENDGEELHFDAIMNGPSPELAFKFLFPGKRHKFDVIDISGEKDRFSPAFFHLMHNKRGPFSLLFRPGPGKTIQQDLWEGWNTRYAQDDEVEPEPKQKGKGRAVEEPYDSEEYQDDEDGPPSSESSLELPSIQEVFEESRTRARTRPTVNFAVEIPIASGSRPVRNCRLATPHPTYAATPSPEPSPPRIINIRGSSEGPEPLPPYSAQDPNSRPALIPDLLATLPPLPPPFRRVSH
ncbi:hypothetical protein SISSUDRAFT_1068018 [Sistotremastrum suecicum HHB10207 ss-3]|uniref:Uncharacterized protein n=1 Tax=Sistotremastrum suecicum HHB10207 ss-3 TaxID=1314776 RepID=A0A165WHR4_9AGAM|nr:hypothetical protein SISSUDRAFT_1068018 [Sistotremastrum suecicum HHB10207 ss-3]